MNTIQMFLLFFCYCLTSLVVAKCSGNNENLSLELVQVLLRHGARTPEYSGVSFHNFTMPSHYEPLGLAQLTDAGRKQEYEFGLFLRNRYNNYLNTYYEYKDVYAYASSYDRTQMSLQLVLNGIYSIRDPNAWDSHVMGCAIPYVSMPRSMDILIESPDNPKFVKLNKKILKSHEFVTRMARFSEFTKFVQSKTKMNAENEIPKMKAIFDCLISNEHMGQPLPDWYTPEVKQSFIDQDAIYLDSKVATTQLRKMGPGPMIKTFVNNMNLNNEYNNPRKIYLYGAHKVNVAMFLRAHNIKEFGFPPFGSAVILEKLRGRNNQIYVRLLFWDGAGNLKTLNLGNHKKFCPIEDYLSIIKDVIPTDLEMMDTMGNFTAQDIAQVMFRDECVTQRI